MIPINVPIITSSDKRTNGRRPSKIGILISAILLSTGTFLAFFLFLTEGTSSPLPVIGLIIMFMAVIMGLILFSVEEISETSSETERMDNRKAHNISWDSDRSRRNTEYCPECGSLVEFSDSYCATCGSRLD